MQEGLLSPYQAIQCTPFSVFGRDKQVFNNWNPFVNEPMTLPTALAALVRHVLLRDRQPVLQPARAAWAAPPALGAQVRLRPAERPRRRRRRPRPPADDPLEARTYTKARYPKSWQIERLWKPGDSIQLAIGQKDLLVTPLQMTRFYALLANGGRLVTPHLVSSVEQPGTAERPSVVLQRFPPTPPRDTNVSAEAVASIQEGLRAATSMPNGTSVGVFGSFPVPIYGKTGTAEKWSNGSTDARPVVVVRVRADGASPRSRSAS